jgi:hypothetical protein
MAMQELNEQEAYFEILTHIRRTGKPIQAWYAGVARDARQALFKDHGVSQAGSGWIFRTCRNDSTARYVKSALLKLGCDGGPRGADLAPTEVYVYLKTEKTKP